MDSIRIWVYQQVQLGIALIAVIWKAMEKDNRNKESGVHCKQEMPWASSQKSTNDWKQMWMLVNTCPCYCMLMTKAREVEVEEEVVQETKSEAKVVVRDPEMCGH